MLEDASNMDEEDYESDFEESTVRTSPTKSITLPYTNSHYCFTRSYGFESSVRTPSTARSDNPADKYLKSSFPDLFGLLGSSNKLRTSRENNNGESKKDQKKGLVNLGEEIRKRSEDQWSRIEDVVKGTSQRYDDYCKNLEIKNELQLKENQDRNQKQKQALLEMEQKKKNANIKNSSYARIWNHHAYMRELGNKQYNEKLAKLHAKKAAQEKRARNSSWDRF